MTYEWEILVVVAAFASFTGLTIWAPSRGASAVYGAGAVVFGSFLVLAVVGSVATWLAAQP